MDIRIKNISEAKKNEIKSIASYYGQTMSTFIKREIIKIVDSHPEHIKNRVADDEKEECV